VRQDPFRGCTDPVQARPRDAPGAACASCFDSREVFLRFVTGDASSASDSCWSSRHSRREPDASVNASKSKGRPIASHPTVTVSGCALRDSASNQAIPWGLRIVQAESKIIFVQQSLWGANGVMRAVAGLSRRPSETLPYLSIRAKRSRVCVQQRGTDTGFAAAMARESAPRLHL
jgi:hypothetical protein